RQDAGAATEVEQATAVQTLAVEPLQAQRCGRMGAGTEGQPGVEQQIDCLWLGRLVPARNYPQAPAKAHRLEVVHPAAFPVLILDALQIVLRQVAAKQEL